ncbi:hypothetical protein Y032_0275g1070 [Ancylostoma ceylanicum]|uniref:Thiamin pyrophosphokinase catalytic domain-containing protein n=1 Tax=Ancylostoma ceylanicum TaxID=53326 RepID=A0A016S7T5_9BILA|nr:hypothetical protein Y032_0275g1070 [Ancylostoma ceylanicum]
MVRHLSPLDCLLKPASNVCIWLNGAVEAERPSWARLWNVAQKRYSTDGGANRIVGREPELAPPDVVLGDMDSILSIVAEGLKSRCLLVHAPDQDKTDLTKCLEYIAQDFKKGLQLGFLFHISSFKVDVLSSFPIARVVLHRCCCGSGMSM